MLRYIRLYIYFIRFSFSKALEFRMDFFFRIFMDLVFYASAIGFFQVLFLHTATLGGWNEPQAMIFVASFLLLDGICMTLFSNNIFWLPIFVNQGDVDYYLVRPVSTSFFLSLRDFSANSFFNFIFALGIFFWAIARYPDPLSIWQILLFFFYLSFGVVLYLCVQTAIVIPAFWTHSKSGFDLTVAFSDLADRPDRIFKGWGRRVLTTVLPFSLMASFPTRLFIEEFSWEVFGHLAGVTATFVLINGLLWKLALRHYASASS